MRIGYSGFMPSPLIPVVITDKNGRVTTVHRRSATSTKPKTLPKPVMRDFVGEAAKALLEIGIEEQYAVKAIPNLAYLAEHDPLMLDEIKKRCSRPGIEQRIWYLRLQFNELFSGSVAAERRDELRNCRALLELYPVASRISETEGKVVPGIINMMIRDTLEYCSRYQGSSDWSTEKMAMVACRFIDDDDERHHMIFTHWKRVDEIVDLIPELARRGKVDSETLEMLLDSEYPALRDGEL